VRAREFWKTVVDDRGDLLERVVGVLTAQGIRYCVVGGQAVNAYAEPVVSLDLDLAVNVQAVPAVEDLLRRHSAVARFAHRVNVSAPDSDLRVQIQTDPRYTAFVDRAVEQEVLGTRLPVAAVEDVLQGKVWAATDPERRPSKRQKDLADIARLLEADPRLRVRVPGEVLARLV
jgi:hypothetical protein